MMFRTFRRHVASSRCTNRFGEPEIAVVLGNLVLQDQVIPERIPSQIRDQPVILMTIVAIVRKDQIWRATLASILRKTA